MFVSTAFFDLKTSCATLFGTRSVLGLQLVFAACLALLCVSLVSPWSILCWSLAAAGLVHLSAQNWWFELLARWISAYFVDVWCDGLCALPNPFFPLRLHWWWSRCCRPRLPRLDQVEATVTVRLRLRVGSLCGIPSWMCNVLTELSILLVSLTGYDVSSSTWAVCDPCKEWILGPTGIACETLCPSRMPWALSLKSDTFSLSCWGALNSKNTVSNCLGCLAALMLLRYRMHWRHRTIWRSYSNPVTVIPCLRRLNTVSTCWMLFYTLPWILSVSSCCPCLCWRIRTASVLSQQSALWISMNVLKS